MFVFNGNYTVEKLHNLIVDPAESEGEAQPAEEHFIHFHNGIEVQTGGASIQVQTSLLVATHKLMIEFSEVKLFDEATNDGIKHTCYAALKIYRKYYSCAEI